MKKANSKAANLLLIILLFIGCTNSNTSIPDSAVDNTATLKGEVDSAFQNIWQNVTLTNFAKFQKTHLTDDFFTIDADGIATNKEELLADTMRLRMLEILKFKFFDQQTKVYDNVGIVNGRIQAFSDGNYVAEVLYTAIFIKQNGIWKYKNWQGTWSKDSPLPPAFMPNTK